MHVRSFRLSDYAAVNHLFEETLSAECYEETVEAFARQISWDSELVLVAVNHDHQPVGVLIGTIDNNHKGYYYRIAVGLQSRGKGVAKLLIKGLKQKFMNRKVKKILINMDVHNQMHVPLYEALGYEEHDFHDATNRLRIVNG